MKKILLILLLIFNTSILIAQPPQPANEPNGKCWGWHHHHHHHDGDSAYLGTGTALLLVLGTGFVSYKIIKNKKINKLKEN